MCASVSLLTAVLNIFIFGSFIFIFFSYHPVSKPSINRQNSIYNPITLSSQTKYGIMVKDHSTAENRIEFAHEHMNQTVVSLGSMSSRVRVT